MILVAAVRVGRVCGGSRVLCGGETSVDLVSEEADEADADETGNTETGADGRLLPGGEVALEETERRR